MILIVKEGCQFCDKFADVPGLQIATLVTNPATGRTMMHLSGLELHPPAHIPGVPALLDGEHIYVGKTVIEEKLLPLKMQVQP